MPGKRLAEAQQPHDFIKHSIKTRSQKISEFKALYESGLSLRQIQARTGLCKNKIRNDLERMGVVIRDFSRGSKQRHDLTQVVRSGAIPFGYTYLEGKLVVEPSEYRVVLEIFRRVETGQSLRSIAQILNERKVPTRFGKKWNHDVIKQIYRRYKQDQTKEKNK